MDKNQEEAVITITFDAPISLVRRLEHEAYIHGRCSRSAIIRLVLDQGLALRALAANEKTA